MPLQLQIKNRVAEQTARISWLFPYELFWAMKFSPLLICTLLVVSISPALDVSAVQVTGEPFSYTETLHKSAANAKPHDVQKRANGKVQAGYFSNW